MMKLFHLVLVGGIFLCEPALADSSPQYNPASLGDVFDKQRFLSEDQAGSIGINIQGPVGMLATENADKTLTVHACSALKPDVKITSVSDTPNTAFNAVVDAQWGLKASFLGITLGLGGSSEKNVTGVPLAEALVVPTDLQDNLAARAVSCGIEGQVYVVLSDKEYLITSKTFVSGELAGNLIYVRLSGNTYSETGVANFNVVSLFALPVGKVGGTTKAIAAVSDIKAANAHVIGLPSAKVAKALGVNRDDYLAVSPVTAATAKLTSKALEVATNRQ